MTAVHPGAQERAPDAGTLMCQSGNMGQSWHWRLHFQTSNNPTGSSVCNMHLVESGWKFAAISSPWANSPAGNPPCHHHTPLESTTYYILIKLLSCLPEFKSNNSSPHRLLSPRPADDGLELRSGAALPPPPHLLPQPPKHPNMADVKSR